MDREIKIGITKISIKNIYSENGRIVHKIALSKIIYDENKDMLHLGSML